MIPSIPMAAAAYNFPNLNADIDIEAQSKKIVESLLNIRSDLNPDRVAHLLQQYEQLLTTESRLNAIAEGQS